MKKNAIIALLTAVLISLISTSAEGHNQSPKEVQVGRTGYILHGYSISVNGKVLNCGVAYKQYAYTWDSDPISVSCVNNVGNP